MRTMSWYTREELRIRRKVRETERKRKTAESNVRAIDCISNRPRLVLIQGGAA